jgi:hypothetical protein
MQKATLIIGAALLVSYFIFTEILDWIGRLDVIRAYFPRFPAFLERRAFRVALLLVAIALLVRVVSEGGSNKSEIAEVPSPTSQSVPVQQPGSAAPAQTNQQGNPQSQSAEDATMQTNKDSHPTAVPEATKPVESTVPSISQSNSGGINVQQATTGKDSPIIDSPITINAPPRRVITPTQNETMSKVLSVTPEKHKPLLLINGADETQAYALQLAPIFQSSKWPLFGGGAATSNFAPTGNELELRIYPGNASAIDDAKVIQNAFSQAGINVPIIEDTMMSSNPDNVHILVFPIAH